MEAIPGYLIDRKISSGGTAGVYRALDLMNDRYVALKILFPKWSKEPHAVQLLEREAHLLKTLQHPHIVRGVASGHYRGLHWIAMEWIAGETTLERMHRTGKFTEAGTLEMARQMAEAVRYMWRNGIVHGDIKPANIILGQGGVAKLCDFGFAQVVKDGSFGSAFGTRVYASPEQCEGAPDLDCRADLYSLGATLYHLATGRMPPEADPWGGPPSLGPGVAPMIQWVLRGLLAPARGDRYATAELLLKDIDQVTKIRRRGAAPIAAPSFRLDFN
jgi:serine/threonine-protein kinase